MIVKTAIKTIQRGEGSSLFAFILFGVWIFNIFNLTEGESAYMIAFMLGEITTKSFTINYYLYHGAEKESEWLSTILVQNKEGKPIHTIERAKLYARQYESLDGCLLWDIEPAQQEDGLDVITINSGSGVIKKVANEREARQTFGSK